MIRKDTVFSRYETKTGFLACFSMVMVAQKERKQKRKGFVNIMVHERGCEMGKTKRETKEPATSIAAKTNSRRILVAEDDKRFEK